MRPLEGVRILDFTHVLAGPFATRVLADMGADVVKVNSIERSAGNPAGSPYYTIWNRNKRALALNMSIDEAKQIGKALANKADVVIDNFSHGVLDRWGLGFDVTREENPGVIYVQMSGMGDGGPWSNFVTYAPTIHALAGMTYSTGVKGREDIGIGYSYNDHQAGLHGALAILAAIESRNHSGQGQKIDMAQFEVGVALMGPSLLDFICNGRSAEPSGNKLPYDAIAPHGVYPCKSRKGGDILDERWIAIACMTDEHWYRLKRTMESPSWAESVIYQTAESRYANSEEIDELISRWTSSQDARELMDELQRNGVPAGIVQDAVDLVERDPQLASNEFLQWAHEEHPVVGRSFIDRLPIYFGATPCDEYTRSRVVGEDNAEVLADWLGMSHTEVEKLEDSGTLS